MLRTQADVRRLVLEAAEDDVRDGGGWLEIQVDPTGYARGSAGSPPSPTWCSTRPGRLGGDRPRDGGGDRRPTAPGTPLDARTLARLAGQYAGRGVVGFGLSNDERRGATADFAPAFRIAERAGLLLVPHGGELRGPSTSGTASDSLGADRLGHGVRVGEDPALLERIVDAGVALEVCPVSNVPLGVYSDPTSVPLPTLPAAGATVALGADDPLLFGSRLVAQYATMRAAHALDDETLAELACDVGPGLRGPDDVRTPASDGHRRLAGPRLDAQSVQPTSTGSLTRRTPNGASTPSRTSRASASRSRWWHRPGW